MNQVNIKMITPQEMYNLLQGGNGLMLYDVRTPMEYREVHAKDAVNMPLNELIADQIKARDDITTETPLYFICKARSRGRKACENLLKAGFQNIYNVEGGTDAWAVQGLPVIRGKKSISLERQVRITAGFMALSGVIAGYFVHPGFYGLSAFVGAGLIFAGITDICSMGIILSKMPWNK